MSAGHTQDMMKRMQQNEALRKKNYFRKYDGAHSSGVPLEDSDELSPEMHEALINKIREAEKKESRRLIFVLSALLLLGLIAIIMWVNL